MKNLTLAIALLFAIPLMAQRKAFPLAEGSAAGVTTGGSGGQIIHVTNLNDSGPGSFREALFTKGARIIVFDVSGTIEMQSGIYLSGSEYDNLTIAGQTAPEGGITLKGHYTYFDGVDNIIIRYMRFRMDRTNGGLALSTLVTWGCQNVVMDHLSVSYGRDENITIWAGGTSPTSGAHTLMRSVIGDGKNNIVAGSDPSQPQKAGNSTICKNLIFSGHRTPNTSGMARFDIYNNFVFNWQFRLSTIGGDEQFNQVNNFYRAGEVIEQTVSGDGSGGLVYFQNWVGPLAAGGIYTTGNEYENYSFYNSDNWNAWRVFGNTSQQPPAGAQRNTAWPYLGVDTSVQTLNWVKSSLLDDVGANKYLNADGTFGTYIDTNDQLYINSARNDNAGTTGLNSNRAGYWQLRWYDIEDPPLQLPFPNLPQNTRPAGYDTDGDGMPNVYEIANGYNPNVADGTTVTATGYTRVENFLNGVDGNTPVTGVTVTPETASGNVDETIQLTRTVAPANASNQSGTWTSQSPSVASVDQNGLVTLLTVGTATIVFQTSDGGFTDTSIITSNPRPNIPVTGVTVAPTTVSLAVGQTSTATRTIQPANAGNQNGTWSALAPGVATVNQSGIITGVSAGTTIVKFTTEEGSFVGQIAVTVTSTAPPPTPTPGRKGLSRTTKKLIGT